MDTKNLIRSRAAEFEKLCQQFDVKSMYVFGSSIAENPTKLANDVDLLVELSTQDPVRRGENLLGLWDLLEQFFQQKVDLVTDASLRNPYLKKSIHSTKVLLYDGKNLKISF
jgi:predicted nucleotidyltransferase